MLIYIFRSVYPLVFFILHILFSRYNPLHVIPNLAVFVQLFTTQAIDLYRKISLFQLRLHDTR